MPRSRRTVSIPPSPRRLARNRHGRGLRSSVVGPYLPMLRTRIDMFDMTIASTAEYLRGLWPAELGGVGFEVAAAPEAALHGDHVDRWKVDHQARRIVFFRLPILRFSRLHEGDEMHERMLVESCVFRAVADLLGKDPWELAPERFRHF
jgi:hypothetical protein